MGSNFNGHRFGNPLADFRFSGAMCAFYLDLLKKRFAKGFWSIFLAVFSTSTATIGFLLFKSFLSVTGPFASLQPPTFLQSHQYLSPRFYLLSPKLISALLGSC